jgi:hypothetical protein
LGTSVSVFGKLVIDVAGRFGIIEVSRWVQVASPAHFLSRDYDVSGVSLGRLRRQSTPQLLRQLAANLRGHVAGGVPYSEGIFEVVNKFFWTQFYGQADRPTDDILAEYATYYLDLDSAADAVRLCHLFEKMNPRRNWKVQNLKEADEAWTLAQAIDGRLPAWAKTSWRWRILYIRAAIEHGTRVLAWHCGRRICPLPSLIAWMIVVAKARLPCLRFSGTAHSVSV